MMSDDGEGYDDEYEGLDENEYMPEEEESDDDDEIALAIIGVKN